MRSNLDPFLEECFKKWRMGRPCLGEESEFLLLFHCETLILVPKNGLFFTKMLSNWCIKYQRAWFIIDRFFGLIDRKLYERVGNTDPLPCLERLWVEHHQQKPCFRVEGREGRMSALSGGGGGERGSAHVGNRKSVTSRSLFLICWKICEDRDASRRDAKAIARTPTTAMPATSGTKATVGTRAKAGSR